MGGAHLVVPRTAHIRVSAVESDERRVPIISWSSAAGSAATRAGAILHSRAAIMYIATVTGGPRMDEAQAARPYLRGARRRRDACLQRCALARRVHRERARPDPSQLDLSDRRQLQHGRLGRDRRRLRRTGSAHRRASPSHAPAGDSQLEPHAYAGLSACCLLQDGSRRRRYLPHVPAAHGRAGRGVPERRNRLRLRAPWRSRRTRRPAPGRTIRPGPRAVPPGADAGRVLLRLAELHADARRPRSSSQPRFLQRGLRRSRAGGCCASRATMACRAFGVRSSACRFGGLLRPACRERLRLRARGAHLLAHASRLDHIDGGRLASTPGRLGCLRRCSATADASSTIGSSGASCVPWCGGTSCAC